MAGAARPPVDAINPRVNNVYGHIITWTYRYGLQRADVHVGRLCALRRPGRRRARLDDRSATSSARPTGSTSRRAADSGFRPTCRRRRSTPATTRGSATTRCCAPIRRPARYDDSCRPEAVRDHRRLRRRPTRRRCSSASSTRVRRRIFRALRRPQRPGEHRSVQLVAGRRRGRAPAFGVRRDHEGRRRGDRELRLDTHCQLPTSTTATPRQSSGTGSPARRPTILTAYSLMKASRSALI